MFLKMLLNIQTMDHIRHAGVGAAITDDELNRQLRDLHLAGTTKPEGYIRAQSTDSVYRAWTDEQCSE
jgi:hypothetical protein